ncbi:MAG: DUF3631 domain-containing protein [Fibrobacterota bacterium]|nr:MAG: DUF3631 domain-containing protein [Fibrobacterota bacterium]
MTVDQALEAKLEAKRKEAAAPGLVVVPNASGTESDPEALNAEVRRLASMPRIEYAQARENAAKRLGVGKGALDQAVRAAQREEQEATAKSGALTFPEVIPWGERVDGVALLSAIRDTVRDFIVCEDETAVAVALWSAFTWFVDVAKVAPIAIITAPEKQCGKTQLLDIMGKLARRPLPVSNITAAALFRVIEQATPTLLIDEADSFLARSDDLRGIINSGHSRTSAQLIRTVGDDHEPKVFSTWGAKVICGIGKLAETIMDRGIILELRRKLPTEQTKRLRHADPERFATLCAKLARWSDDNSEVVRRARPDLPDALNDREQDSWEPLLAIADLAGGIWPELARSTARRLSEKNAENTVSTGAELLADIREVFQSRGEDKLSTKSLLADLTKDEEKSWATFNRGLPMKPPQLAKRLSGYGISPGTIRTFEGTPKGYRLEQFKEAFDRYLKSGTPEV